MSEEEFLDFPNSSGNTLTPIPVNGLGFEQHTLVSFAWRKRKTKVMPLWVVRVGFGLGSNGNCGTWPLQRRYPGTGLRNACMHLDHALIAHEPCSCCCKLLSVLPQPIC